MHSPHSTAVLAGEHQVVETGIQQLEKPYRPVRAVQAGSFKGEGQAERICTKARVCIVYREHLQKVRSGGQSPGE